MSANNSRQPEQGLSGDPVRQWIRRLFVLNGVLAPVIFSTQVYANMAYAGTPWRDLARRVAATLQSRHDASPPAA